MSWGSKISSHSRSRDLMDVEELQQQTQNKHFYELFSWGGIYELIMRTFYCQQHQFQLYDDEKSSNSQLWRIQIFINHKRHWISLRKVGNFDAVGSRAVNLEWLWVVVDISELIWRCEMENHHHYQTQLFMSTCSHRLYANNWPAKAFINQWGILSIPSRSASKLSTEICCAR